MSSLGPSRLGRIVGILPHLSILVTKDPSVEGNFTSCACLLLLLLGSLGVEDVVFSSLRRF
jgi:hypothetical protein